MELANVSFGYDRRRPVLKHIDMTIPRGKVVAIMGGSGCGKTTILRLIGGQIRPQSGKVIAEVVTDDAPKQIDRLLHREPPFFVANGTIRDPYLFANRALAAARIGSMKCR